MLSQLLLAAAMFLSAADVLHGHAVVPFRVIAHPSVPATTLSPQELSAIFMRRTRSWRDGTPSWW